MKELKTIFDIDFSHIILNDSKYDVAPFKKRSEMTIIELLSEEQREKPEFPILLHSPSLSKDDYSTSGIIQYTEKQFKWDPPKIEFPIKNYTKPN